MVLAMYRAKQQEKKLNILLLSTAVDEGHDAF